MKPTVRSLEVGCGRVDDKVNFLLLFIQRNPRIGLGLFCEETAETGNQEHENKENADGDGDILQP